ncbi:hypothetical protein M427DRAFT_158231 [Gonapodya prolifera JEL478]|uniref:Uncharacterized protein n=1 Tax=Gonapodya prolifera (strain JEL478) TaxID=1344416 RepID=A0A139A3B9_GONPJ|nr:hypothetical protein M427DRAFT_158231 [Gonapodya prolifera JEL478]|eukprot:KXS11316.1 hypothetical protein M427DRAFT_158231 [Gonapodya prolifera JEL478]
MLALVMRCNLLIFLLETCSTLLRESLFLSFHTMCSSPQNNQPTRLPLRIPPRPLLHVSLSNLTRPSARQSQSVYSAHHEISFHSPGDHPRPIVPHTANRANVALDRTSQRSWPSPPTPHPGAPLVEILGHSRGPSSGLG